MNAVIADDYTDFVSNVTLIPSEEMLTRIGYSASRVDSFEPVHEVVAKNVGRTVTLSLLDFVLSIDRSVDFYGDDRETLITRIIDEKLRDWDMSILSESMRVRGQQHPIGCSLNDEGELVMMNGHHRLVAALYLGMPTIRVFVQKNVHGVNFESTGDNSWDVSLEEEELGSDEEIFDLLTLI